MTHMVNKQQAEQIEKLIAEGYLNSGQIAKQLGLLKEYVDAYMKAKA